jgi:hypothetical protein
VHHTKPDKLKSSSDAMQAEELTPSVPLSDPGAQVEIMTGSSDEHGLSLRSSTTTADDKKMMSELSSSVELRNWGGSMRIEHLSELQSAERSQAHGDVGSKTVGQTAPIGKTISGCPKKTNENEGAENSLSCLGYESRKNTPTAYYYSSLPLGKGYIRLLRLIPDRDKTAAIRCELFNYSLESGRGDHLFEALSYVWGDPKETVPIYLHGSLFNATSNLHAALLRLRNHTMARIIWVDAICIDQGNTKEKQHQIQYMAEIYGQAKSVVVWLGNEADGSHKALEEIRVAAEESLPIEKNNQRVIALLQRPWFERIWVS